MKLGRDPKDLAATTAEPHPPAGGAPGTATPVGSPRPATAYAEAGSRSPLTFERRRELRALIDVAARQRVGKTRPLDPRCKWCGEEVPQQDAQGRERARDYCSEEHRRQFASRYSHNRRVA